MPFLFAQIFPDIKPEIRYYGVTKIRRQDRYGPDIQRKSIQFADNLRQVRNFLQKTGVIFRATGSLKVRDRDRCKQCGATDYKYQEKGVDVGLAVDITNDVLTGQVDHVILVSSDTDLIPALKITKSQHKTLTYVGFGDQLTKALCVLADNTQVIRNSELINAYQRANPLPQPLHKLHK